MAKNDIVLYSYFRSSCSWRVRIALELKKLDYEIRPVNLLKAEHKDKDNFVGSVNVMPQVPALRHNDVTVCQSVAIMEYLDEVFPDHLLLPKGNPAARAAIREIVDIIACDIQPVQNLRILQWVGDEKKEAHAKHWISFGFEALENKLQETSGKYCYGDELTMADCCLVPQCYNAIRFGVDLNQFPTIKRINESLKTLEAFAKADFSVQPDCPAELRG